MPLDKQQKSFLKKFVPVATFLGGLCCFTPVILVFFGLSSITFAASLGDNLYYNYRWIFRGAALLFLFLGLSWYFYKKEHICSLNALKRKRRKVINFTLIVLALAVLGYLLWLYVIVEIIGILMGIWSSPI